MCVREPWLGVYDVARELSTSLGRDRVARCSFYSRQRRCRGDAVQKQKAPARSAGALAQRTGDLTVETTELLVFGEAGEGRVISAHFAFVVAANAQFAEALIERVVHQELADQRLAESDDEFHYFDPLE